MADPVRGIQLVGAPNALPADLAAQAQQAALQQQLAQALLGSSMEMGSPVIHTGGSNPFARDVVNLAPLGKIVQSLMGSKGMEASSNTMAQLAQAGEARRQSDLGASGEYIPTQANDPMGGAPGENPDQVPMMRPPSTLEQNQRLQMSSHPSNQALAQSLLEHQFTNEEKQMMTPEAYSSLSSARGGNISPEAINRMIYRQPVTGAPAMRMGNTTASGAPVNVVNAAGQPVIGQPGGLTSADKQQPRIIENPDGSTTAIPPSGTPVNLKNPTSEGAETAVKNLSETLEEGRGRTRAFQSVAPIVTTMMKLADIEKNNLGWGAAQITEARQLAKRLGVSDDKANDISNIQTLMKYALTPAIETARSLTTRPSQMEFMKTLEASAADPKVDARAALNIFRGFLVNGLNATETHNKNLGIAEGMPSMKANVPVYKVPEMGDEDKLAESVLGRLGEKGAPSFHFERDKNGVWYDKGVVDDPQAKIEADKKNNLVTKTLPNGKAAYKNPANGKWYDNPEFK